MRTSWMKFVAAVCIMGAGAAEADEASHRDLAKRLMTAMQVQQDLEMSLEMMKKAQMQRMEKLAASSGRSPAETRFLGKKVIDLVSEEMSWEKLEEDCIGVYMGAFPEEHIEEIIEFFESPAGKKFVEGTPMVREGMTRITQQRMRVLGPKIQALAQSVREIQGTP